MKGDKAIQAFLDSNTAGVNGKVNIGMDSFGNFVINNRQGSGLTLDGFVHTGSN